MKSEIFNNRQVYPLTMSRLSAFGSIYRFFQLLIGLSLRLLVRSSSVYKCEIPQNLSFRD